MVKYEMTHYNRLRNGRTNTDDCVKFKAKGVEYEKQEEGEHAPFFYDPSIPLEDLNSTTYVFGVKIRYYQPWKAKLKRSLPPLWFWPAVFILGFVSRFVIS